MPTGSRDYELLDEGGAGRADKPPALPELLAEASGTGLTWTSAGPARTAGHTWLDTFDWRLYRAGLTLEQTGSGRSARLVLTGRAGELLAAEDLAGPARPSWPSLLMALPAGPLRELLEPATGIRALGPVARATSKVRTLRALNNDGKIVARLELDQMTVTFPARAQAPLRLTLAPVRGYAGQVDKAGRAIGGLPGVSPMRGSALEAALAAAGRRPGELTGKSAAVQLSPELPAGPALASVLLALLDALTANVQGTVRDVDTEFLHDLRIATRWTRSALKLCGGALPPGLARDFRPEFRWLGELTTPTRDLDVYLLGFGEMAAGLIAADESDLTPFGDHLLRSRTAAHRHLTRGLRSARFARLTAEWRAALLGIRPARKQPPVSQLAAARIAAAQRKALRAGRLITSAAPPQSLHDLRKDCKELRYLVEMFGSLYDPAQRWQAVRELRALQDCLGAFQDAEVQRAEIRAFASQMLVQRSAPAPTLLAMGEVAAGLARRQRQARVQFDGRFADFARPASQARLIALVGPVAA